MSLRPSQLCFCKSLLGLGQSYSSLLGFGLGFFGLRLGLLGLSRLGLSTHTPAIDWLRRWLRWWRRHLHRHGHDANSALNANTHIGSPITGSNEFKPDGGLAIFGLAHVADLDQTAILTLKFLALGLEDFVHSNGLAQPV